MTEKCKNRICYKYLPLSNRKKSFFSFASSPYGKVSGLEFPDDELSRSFYSMKWIKEMRKKNCIKINSGDAYANIFVTPSQYDFVLFPGTPLLEEAERGEFTPLSEKEMLEELLLFVENLTCDCTFITHHTVSGKNLTGPDFLERKDKIVTALRNEIEHGDMDLLAAIRRNKRTL